jgi:hypothetical protein
MNVSEFLTRYRFDKSSIEHVKYLFGLHIAGIEVTQAVQHFNSDEHLTDSDDYGSDNSIRLVAGKPAWVRVYLWSAYGSSGITGTLEVRRRSHGFLYSTVATLSPSSTSVTSVPAVNTTTYADTRRSLSRTLNFVIPAVEMIGGLRLIARVTSGSQTVERTVDVGVHLRQTLRLAGVMISYNGPASSAPNAPNLTLAAPALTDLQNMSGTALTLFPVESTANFRTAGTLTQTNHLQDSVFPASGCGAEWDALHGRVANARTADGNQPGWIYYGLLPAGTPMGPVGGCGGGGVAVGPINQPGTLAHEAGHACGLDHAPAGGAPNPDPDYPAYEPYDPANTPRASVGEFGLNVNNGNIADPQTFKDFMSYAAPTWISPYHYGLLLDNDRLSPTTVGMDNWWWKDLVWEEVKKWPQIPEPDPPFDVELPVFPPSRLQEVISLIVKVERGVVTEVLHVARTRAHTHLRGARPTAFSVRLLDAEGSVVGVGALHRLDTAACGCGGADRTVESNTYLAQAFVPDAAVGAALEITAEDEVVVWRREAPPEPPRVEVSEPKTDRRGNVTLSWSASAGVEEFWVRWSRDRENWQSVATGLAAQKLRIEAGQLPGGDGFLQVVAHDGFFSSYSEPVRVALPDRHPEAVILHPVEGHTYAAGQPVRLWGSIAGEEPREAADAIWLVGGDEIARGLDAFVELEPGEQTVTLRVGEQRLSVSVTAVSLREG